MTPEDALEAVDQNELLEVEGGAAAAEILTDVSKTVIKGLKLDIKDIAICGGPNGPL